MRRSQRRRWGAAGTLLLLWVAVGGLVLVGCGGTSPSTSPSATPSPTASASPIHQKGLVWKFETGSAVHARPAVSGDVAYVANDDGRLYAVDATSGQQLWQSAAGAAVRAALVLAGGTVYCRTEDGTLHAVDAQSGEERWQFAAAGAPYSPPAVAGGHVFLGAPSTSADKADELYALAAEDGQVLWKTTLSWAVTTEDDAPPYAASPAAAGGVVYYCPLHVLYTLDGGTGKQLWKTSRGSPLSGAPAVAGGVVFTIRQVDNWPVIRSVRADDAKNGTRQWQAGLPAALESLAGMRTWSSSPVVAGSAVYVIGGDGTVFALERRSGAEIWRSGQGLAEASSTPAIAGGIVCVTRDGRVLALDAATGKTAWRFATVSSELTPPVIADGVAYVGGSDGALYAVTSAKPLPAPTTAGVIAFGNVTQRGTWTQPAESAVCIIRTDGSGLRQLTDARGREIDPAWSPDGRWIAYGASADVAASSPEEQWELWNVSADGSSRRQLTQQFTPAPSRKLLQDATPAWSSDGRRIAFARTTYMLVQEPSEIEGTEGTLEENANYESQLLYVIGADGSGLRRVTPATATETSAEYSPAWAPDGSILYLRGDVEGVWSVKPDDRDPNRVSQVNGIYDFALSPDGHRLAIVNGPEDAIQIIRLDGAGAPRTVLSSVTELVPDGAAAIRLTWSPDGRALALAGNSRLYVVNADGSGLSVVPGIKRANAPAWRPE